MARIRTGTGRTLPKVAALIAVVGAIAYGAPVTIFWDDFQDDAVGTNPNPPPVGEPWQISEISADGVNVAADVFDPANNVLEFGRYRNQAVVPFSADQQQRIAEAQNAALSFSYYGFSTAGYSHYFDVGGYDALTGDPAFFIRMLPQASQGMSGRHDVYYLDPLAGLVDSGLDIASDATQSVTITADFISELYELNVEGNTATLPLFRCPSTIADVQLANYGVFMGSGSIDDVSVTVDEPTAPLQTSVPETATALLLAAGGIILACFWFVRRKGS